MKTFYPPEIRMGETEGMKETKQYTDRSIKLGENGARPMCEKAQNLVLPHV